MFYSEIYELQVTWTVKSCESARILSVKKRVKIKENHCFCLI